MLALKCAIHKVVLVRDLPVFILVQFMKENQQQPHKSIVKKMRTELSFNTNRPLFKQNQFVFDLYSPDKHNRNINMQNQVYSIKFGLMHMKCDSFGRVMDEDYQTAKPIAIASLKVSLQRLKQLGSKGERKYFDLMDCKNKVIGQFQVSLELFSDALREFNKQSNQENNYGDLQNKSQIQLENQIKTLDEGHVLFNPLINWMMFDENCKDPLRQQNSIKALQKQSNILYSKFHDSKTEEQRLESIFNELQQDQKQLLLQLQTYEKLNNKINQKLDQKQSLQALRLQIDMLRRSREGKQLLLEKVQYFQDRIFRQQEIYEQLLLKYEKIKPDIQRKLKQSELINQKLKGKQQQDFQIKNNIQILKAYEKILYEYKSNEQVINSLAKLSKQKSLNQYTRKQAELFLSQVKYEIKLQELDLDNRKRLMEEGEERYEDKLLNLIEDEMKNANIAKEQLNTSSEEQYHFEQQQMVMRIKLQSLLEEIQKIKQKISKVKEKKPFLRAQKSLMSTQ